MDYKYGTYYLYGVITHSPVPYHEHLGVLPPLVRCSQMGFGSEVRQCDIR